MNISNAVNRIYYQLKPFIPRRLQILLRRRLVLQKRLLYKDVWPIDHRAKRPPEGWTGWPEGKKFALVLTHDVETKRGQDKCHQLIKIEKELGFRSSFNFIPERYRVSPELRKHIIDNGFEVGVHDLKHDGKLYKSEKNFKKCAVRINQYLKEWNASGFRSGSMHRRMDWIHSFNIEYDSSTFDTDPFEPQSEGVKTIFPFRVSDNSTNNGYVELPYTLPQDFTLFVLMKEKNIDIWKKKLDWIAEHGGMALIIAHPDYMNFEGNRIGNEEYPAEYYKEFLEYIKSEYEGQYWNVLPKDITRFCSKKITNIHTVNTLKKKDINSQKPNVLMITESPFPADIRVRKEAYSLQEHYKISVIALKRKSDKYYEMLDDIEIFRIPELPGLNFRKVRYVMQYFCFTLAASIIFICTLPKRKYKVIHVHNPPDTLFFVGLLGKMFRTKFVFDHHDLSPELFSTRFPGRKALFYKGLVLFEKLSCKLADVIISTNESYKQIEINRHHVSSNKIHIVRNNPIIEECVLDKSNDIERKKENHKKALLFLGSINPQDGVVNLLQVLHYLVNTLDTNNFICNIVGGGDSLQDVKQIAKDLDLMDYVDFKGIVYDREKIKEYLSLTDIGVEPAPDNELNRLSTFIKIMEYMAARKPIIAFDLKETRYSSNGSALLVLPGDIEGFANAIKELLDKPLLRDELGNVGQERIKKELNWENASRNLLEAYRTLSL